MLSLPIKLALVVCYDWQMREREGEGGVQVTYLCGGGRGEGDYSEFFFLFSSQLNQTLQLYEFRAGKSTNIWTFQHKTQTVMCGAKPEERGEGWFAHTMLKHPSPLLIVFSSFFHL